MKHARHGNQLCLESLDVSEQVENLVGLAALRKRQHNVATDDHTEIAVHGLCGMEKKRRRTGGTEGRCNFARNQPALPHARHDNATTTGVKTLDGTVEGGTHGTTQAVGKLAQGLGLDANLVFAC